MTKTQYHQKHAVKRQKKASKSPNEGSTEEVLLADVKSLLERGPETAPFAPRTLHEKFSEIDVTISELSSTGDGIGVVPGSDHVFVVPFTVPGDHVKAKIVNHFPDAHYTLTDFVEVIKPGPKRNDSLIKCPYFARCGGCQIQMLPYDAQLHHKKTIVEKAYRNFSSLTPETIPAVGATIESPLQYGYRTKLTPHFDGPPGSLSRAARRDPSSKKVFETVPPIGFQMKGMRKTIDIEDCPIGTDAVREGMKNERERVTREIAKFTKGATLLLRENTSRAPKKNELAGREVATNDAEINPSSVEDDQEDTAGRTLLDGQLQNFTDYVEEKTCVTDQRAISTEYVDDFVFKNTAGAFFQNNNSILSPFLAYIRKHIKPFTPAINNPLEYLIDAYCGSGLFTVALSSLFFSSMGIDIAEASVIAARANATANNIKNASFMTADASTLFQQVTYPPDKTAVIIDPPRKGCDNAFLQQLLRFGPQKVIYVSCNVHTQARDVGILVEGVGDYKYEIESLQGFDFFPQTGHVEGVAILSRRTSSPPLTGHPMSK
ncbi:MAG: hypothetical protein Q9164_002199 [Protoblastenia rupestris]